MVPSACKSSDVDADTCGDVDTVQCSYSLSESLVHKYKDADEKLSISVITVSIPNEMVSSCLDYCNALLEV